MSIENILAALYSEIKRLQQARSVLEALVETATKPATKKRKHNMSAAARKRIGDPRRKRWAKQKRLNRMFPSAHLSTCVRLLHLSNPTPRLPSCNRAGLRLSAYSLGSPQLLGQRIKAIF
jgi:hypothetical protein